MPKEINVTSDPGKLALPLIAADALVCKFLGTGQENERTRTILKEEIAAVTRDLAGPDPTPTERLLAETAGLAWFALRYAETSTALGGTLAQVEHRQRNADRAHRRLLSTLKTLALVRKLAAPGVSVSVTQSVTVETPKAVEPPEDAPALAELLAARGRN